MPLIYQNTLFPITKNQYISIKSLFIDYRYFRPIDNYLFFYTKLFSKLYHVKTRLNFSKKLSASSLNHPLLIGKSVHFLYFKNYVFFCRMVTFPIEKWVTLYITGK